MVSPHGGGLKPAICNSVAMLISYPYVYMHRILAVFSMGLFCWSGALLAQSEIGGATLSGTVRDPSGAAVPNAKVTAKQTSTGLTRVAQSSSAGIYSFSLLPPGAYELSVEAQGFKTAQLKDVPLAVGALATVDIAMEIGTASDTVTVAAESSGVETERSQTSTTVNTEAVADLPINGRNFLDFTLLTPGVVRDPTRSGDLAFGGQRGTANSLQVDGSDANNVFFGQSVGRAGTGRSPYSFSQDAVQEFQVATNAYGAEYGRAGGGVINVITKSGTNEFHGSAFEFFRDRSMNANTWANNHANGGKGLPKGAYHFNQFGGNIGGPIKKDKIFFFFDYDGQRNTSPNTVILGIAAPSDPLSQQALASLQPYLAPYTQGLNNDVYLGKVDFNISDRQRLSVRYNANRFTGVNFENGGQTSSADHTGNSNVSTDNASGTYTLVVDPATMLEARFTFTRDDEPGEANSSAPEAVIKQNGTTAISIGRNSFSPRYTNVKTYQWAWSLAHVQGRHTFKGGTDMIWQQIGNYFPGNFAGSFTFNSYADFASNKPFSFTQAFAGAGTDGPLSKPNTNEYAFYAQDTWRINDALTINYGVRYDLFEYANPPVKNPDPGLAAFGLDTSRINFDTNNVAARFGFAYKLSKRGSTVLRGGYGTYYGRTPTILTGTAFTQNGIQVQTYTISSNFPAYPNILSAPPALNRTPDIYAFAHDYVQPITHQWSLNLEHQLGRNYVITVGYLGVRGEHLTRTRDINFYPEVPLQGSFANGTPVTFLRHPGTAANPNTPLRADPNFGRISIFDSGADSIYHGGFIQLSKRLSHNFQVLTSYTLAHAIDDRPDFTSVVVGTDDSKNAQDTTYPNLERGRANADIRHRFVFSGIWDIDYAKSLQNAAMRALLSGYQLSTIANVQSGRPYTITVGGDPNNDLNTSTDRPPYVGRNTLEGPSYQTVDIRFTRDIHIHERVALRLMFEAFNLTNRANFSNITSSQYNFSPATRVFTPNPSYLVPTATFDPRILQLAGKITF
jgi:outer membrane receptor protein involved in Fe transport